jgi:hypothetical protein
MGQVSERGVLFLSGVQVLPNGKVWVMGGEYSGAGPSVIPVNEGYYAEIFDPVANTWTQVAPFPNISGCTHSTFGGRISAGSPVMTNILSTRGLAGGPDHRADCLLGEFRVS